jgi:biopolymer transport protein ExbD
MVRKKHRISIFIDMTPMVDVTFLLLTFFMLTTHFRPPQEVEVVLPFSHSAIKLPESDVATILVTKDNKIYLGFDSQNDRIAVFGADFRLRSAVEVEDKNTLATLLIKARSHNPKLRTVLKADRGAPFGPIEDVMQVLEKVNITRFSLVTELEKT